MRASFSRVGRARRARGGDCTRECAGCSFRGADRVSGWGSGGRPILRAMGMSRGMMRAVSAHLLILGATVAALRVEGRVWWCEAGDVTAWCLDVWTRHCSQHLVDPYSLSHVCHGLFFWVVLRWAVPRVGERWRLVMAVGAAA